MWKALRREIGSRSYGKHFYYGHPRQINSDGITHLKRCQLETVRAPRVEEAILKSLKKIATEQGLLDHWLDIYARKTTSELPAIEGRLKTIEGDIRTQNRRIENIVSC